ncbi:pancreatic triacylglycerol lipase-like isoform X2 [Megachile rotundata]|uniref:pancreatic triacylglycerol lipase-like isoform X2 n=1 Tax=Megachile rotundata TaxID=143995 RepID=UPI003FD457E5
MEGDAASVSENVKSAFFRLYNRSGPNMDVSLDNLSQIVPHLDQNVKITVYIPGHSEYLDKETVTPITDALLNYTSDNIIGLDYKEIAALFYTSSVAEVKALCAAAAESVEQLVDAGVDADSIYIIGHSLGAQLSGCIGRSLPFKISRITGLDPAGPAYYFLNRHLSASDAKFVDIIHTDGGVLGEAQPTGTVDFYPNFGHGVQPGCKLELNVDNTALCSHHRSWRFFIDSLKDKDAFIGVKCSNELLYRMGACDKNERAVMGYYASPDTKGVYYLRTGASEPYGLGEAGAPYKSS